MFISTLGVCMFSPLEESWWGHCNGSASVRYRQATDRTVYSLSLYWNTCLTGRQRGYSKDSMLLSIYSNISLARGQVILNTQGTKQVVKNLKKERKSDLPFLIHKQRIKIYFDVSKRKKDNFDLHTRHLINKELKYISL